MKAILQRVSEARVRIDGDIVGEIGAGLMIFIARKPVTAMTPFSAWPKKPPSCASSPMTPEK